MVDGRDVREVVLEEDDVEVCYPAVVGWLEVVNVCLVREEWGRDIMTGQKEGMDGEIKSERGKLGKKIGRTL